MGVGDVSLGATLADAAYDDAAAGRVVLRRHERRAWTVAAISLAVMTGELAGGAWLNSLALQSDGLHMGTHAGVMAISACAYVLARRRGSSPEKTAETLNLAALISGMLLGVTGVGLGVEAVLRAIAPEPVRFGEAALIEALGLAVSVISAMLLRSGHAHAHDAGATGHAQGRDLNLWAAYLHMVADVITSVLALGALLLGMVTGWVQLDTAVGLVNALVVTGFSIRLLRAALGALLR